MRKWIQMSLVAFICVSFLTGCAALMAFFGIETLPDGTTVVKTGGGMAGAIASLIPGYGTIATAGIGALTTLWSAIRGKRYKDAGVSVVRGVKAAYYGYKDDHRLSEKEMLEILKVVQEQDKTRATVNNILGIVSGKKTKSAA